MRTILKGILGLTVIGCAGLCVLIGGLVALAAWNAEDPVFAAHEVEHGGVERIDAMIDIGIGRLTIAPTVPLGGAPDALTGLTGEFQYHPEREPWIDYRVDGDVGRLRLDQRGSGGRWGFNFGWLGNSDDVWTVALARDIPISLELSLGAGTSDLDVRGLDLTELKVDLGAGNTKINLADDWSTSFDARIDGGAGNITVMVPSDEVGVRVRVDQGLGNVTMDGLSASNGAYVNEAWETADVRVDIVIDQGVGNVRVVTEDTASGDSLY